MIFNVGAGGASNAESIKYDNSLSGLEADNVQGAINEVSDSLGGLQFGYDETTQKYGYYKKEADTEVFVPFKSVGFELPHQLSFFGNGILSCSVNTMYFEKYDLTDVQTISFNVIGPTSGSYPFTAGVCDIEPSSVDDFLIKNELSVAKATVSASIDVSKLVGEYYICFCSNMGITGGYIRTVSDIWLLSLLALISNADASSIIASSESSASYAKTLAFDNNSGTCWRANGATDTTPYIGYNFGKEVSVSALSLTPVNTSENNRTPKNFTVQKSDNGTDWVDVQSFTNTVTTAGSPIFFTLNESVKTNYIRLSITSNNASDNYPTIGGLQFYK